MTTELTQDDYVLYTGPMTIEADQKTVVSVLVIEHRFGSDISVFHSDADADTYLAGWVRDWWLEVAESGAAPAEPPTDDTEAISMYFELHGNDTYYRDIVTVR
ncbi:hypothetical protein [Gordonia sihwensis]|uniref:hypothetical protein n=1 Tax=Gordonia sihwensis TaxID=173559 RepID=UPI0005ED4577|nr:hypothetical protein [Gordonia sihwensis]KJR10542.1 hypothetical protein UG54_00670 [Gordonia sihwensis]